VRGDGALRTTAAHRELKGHASPCGDGGCYDWRMAQWSIPERALLAAFSDAVRARFGPRVRDLRVFGSRARGDSDADSDIDVLVAISDVTWQERDAVLDLACDLGTAAGLVLSPLVRDPAALARSTALAAEIARDGVALPEGR
jgi:predicted nucleotidyltransferase